MLTTTKALLDLTEADVMSRDLITILQQMSLRAAAHALARARVSGAPVTDEQGRCVGVLSATDLVRWLDRGEQAARRLADHSLTLCCDWATLEVEEFPPDAVRDHMSTDVVTATPDTPLGELARSMVDAHIHRIVITDDLGKPVGIISTTDVLAAVAREDLLRDR